jgi:hypothetical protein
MAKKPTGRPSTFDPAKVDEIIARVSAGEPLAQVCRDLGMGLTTWYDWVAAHAGLAERIARAREAGEEVIAVECLRIADTPVEAIIEKSTASGVEITRQDALGHRKLQIETRLKLLAKWNPKKWGDKVAVGGADDLPAMKTETTVVLDPSEAYKRLLGNA